MKRKYEVRQPDRGVAEYQVLNIWVFPRPRVIALCTERDDAVFICKLLNNHNETQEYSKP